MATPSDDMLKEMPLWHSVWFSDTHGNTYFSPAQGFSPICTRKSTNKCESEENRELQIGTKMYEYVRIVGMMDMAILPV